MKKLVCCLSLITFLFVATAANAIMPLQDKILMQYKADYLGYADGDPVSSWGDSAFVGDQTPIDTTAAGSYTLSAKTGYGLPTFVANAYNGFPVVRFVRQVDPTTQPNEEKTFLQSGNWSWQTGTAAQSITIFIVAQGGKSDVNQRSLRVGRVGGNNGQIVDCDMRSGTTTGVYGSGARFSNGAAVANGALTEDVWHISVRRIANAANINTFFQTIDGVSKTLAYTNPTNKVTLIDGTDNCVMMGNGTLNNGNFLNEWYDGDIAEVMVYKYLDATTEIPVVYNYLYNKYNNLIAHTPSPAKVSVDQGEVYVAGGAPWRTDVTLSWDKAHNNPQITKHYVYIAQGYDDPNLVSMTNPTAIVDATGDSASTTVRLESGTRHYWRVDEVWDGAEPNQIVGDVWFFTPMAATPRITDQPSTIRVFPGEEAYLEPTIASPTPCSFQWYKTPDNSTTTAPDYAIPAEEGGTLQRLSIPNAEIADEGFYYCTITNEASIPGSPTKTGVRMIGIKRLMGHWSMDSADYATVGSDGYYKDTADNEPNALDGVVVDVKQHAANASVFVDSGYPSLNQAADFGTYPTAPGYSTNTLWSAAYTDRLTVSAWVKWNGSITGIATQGIVANQTSSEEGTSGNSWYLELKTGTNIPWLNVNGSAYDFNAAHQIPVGEWTHIVVTVGSAGYRFWYNCVLDQESTVNEALNNNDATRTARPIYIGCSNRDTLGLRYPFNGLIDDVRIYNYGLGESEIIDLYSDVTGAHFCINPDNDDLSLDVAGGGTLGDEPDCKVNMSDLVGFFADWLNCGLYPASGCE